MWRLRTTTFVAVVASVLFAGGLRAEDAPAAAGELQVGEVLDQSNWQKAKGLMPDEILRHYEKGEYRNRIVDYPVGSSKWEPAWIAATEKNAGQLAVDARGTIVEAGTGKQPDYLYGFPFPVIDPNDPTAGVKIVWNQFLAYWSGGSSYNQTRVAMMHATGIDREIHADGYFNFWDGQLEKYRRPNPNNLQSQFLGVSTYPADLQGTASLTWRYRDPEKRDSVWAFVPALRRVRAVSPANRSDGFLGSDMSQDDGPFFDGKPEDFTWKLKGQTDQLRIVDPLNLQGKNDAIWVPGGGWRANWDPELKIIGFQDPDWRGLAWAPRSAALAKRPMYIVEGIPKDKYYLYGRLELYIDRETFQGSWNRKFSWQGELLNTLQVMGYNLIPKTRPTGEVDYIQGSNMSYNVAENVKANRATVAGLKSNPKAALDSHHPYDPAFFDMNALSRFGK